MMRDAGCRNEKCDEGHGMGKLMDVEATYLFRGRLEE